MDITLIIPTRNRLHFITQLLKYYRDLKFAGKILILDASDDLNHKRLSVVVKGLQELKIQHIKSKLPEYIHNQNFWEITDSLSYVDTEFVSHLGDDDYLIPNGIAQCVQHLRDNKDLAAAQGDGLIIDTPDFNSLPHINAVHPYPGPIRLEDKACDRFVNHFFNYSTPFFAVFRTEIFKKAFNLSLEEVRQHCSYRIISDELLQSALCVIFGKFDKIKALHVIRGIQENRGGEQVKKHATTTTEEDKQKSIAFFAKKIALAINESDQHSITELENIARDSVMSFLKGYNQPNKDSKFKQTIRKILSVVSLLKLVRNHRRNLYNRTELGLISLLKQNNKNHKDFIHVYNSMLSLDNYKIE